MNTSKALVPISVSTQRFTTRRIRGVLPTILDRNSSIYFLIADRLQMYNNAAKFTEGANLNEIVNWNSFPPQYYQQREKWLRKVCKFCRSKNNYFHFVNMDDVCDNHAFVILRNINILYDINSSFRHDVLNQAYIELNKRKSYADFEMSSRLSVHYLLEEIAVNVRIRVIEGIENEYYMGDQLMILPKLYAGLYGIKIFDLAGVANEGKSFNFFYWAEDDDGSGSWQPANATN